MPTKNILMISIDDLNDFVAFEQNYGIAVDTPHLDHLMAHGTTFSNAFCQTALCNPSRTSILTGTTPSTTGVYGNKETWYDIVDPADTLPAIMKNAGFYTVNIGKIFHDAAPMPQEVQDAVADEYFVPPVTPNDRTHNKFSYEIYRGDEKDLRDYMQATEAINFINRAAQGDVGNFFLSVGMQKPHIDWVVPKEYFDLYPLSEINISKFVANGLSDVPQFMRNRVNEEHGEVVDAGVWKEMIQAYLASISFMDAMVGRVINALESSGLAADTAIVLWSDHGYHLGDKDNWGKFTLWEEAARAPLIIVDPDVSVPALGQKVDQVVELVDIFPTILELAGLAPVPAAEGESLVPLLLNPEADWDNVAVTQMWDSYSVRTEQYRYTRYQDGSEELYDIAKDPREVKNLSDVRRFADEKAEMIATLRAYAEAHSIYLDFGQTTTIGSNGDDDLVQGPNTTELVGKKGDDVYMLRDPNTVVVEKAGEGVDQVIVRSSFKMPSNVENLMVMDTPRTTIVGNDLDNIVVGGTEVHGRGGDDRILEPSGKGLFFGAAGDDTLEGAERDDTLSGGSGNDKLDGKSGDDVIEGGAGDDTLDGGGDNDALAGGSGNDLLVDILSGKDTLAGGPGDDTLEGGADSDVLDGGSGLDTARYSASWSGVTVGLTGGVGKGAHAAGDTFISIENIWGSLYDDELTGDDNANALWGDAGNDTLNGAGGDDLLDGGAGNDSLYGGTGADSLIGGAGDDTFEGSAKELDADIIADFSAGDVIKITGVRFGSDAITVTPGSGVLNIDTDGDHTADTVITLEVVFGGKFTATASEASEGAYTLVRYVAGIGGETWTGGPGDDSHVGTAGDDSLDGGAGNDTVYGAGGDDTLKGGNGHDSVGAGVGNDLVLGGAGNDTVHGAGGADTLNGGADDDWLNGDDGADSLIGGSGNDVLHAGQGDDTLRGGGGSDTLNGETGNDVLAGGDSNDVLRGGDGADTLDGGSGDDFLKGNAGADVLVFVGDNGNDTVSGFQDGVDRIDLSAYNSLAVGLAIAQSGNDVLISDYDPSGGTILLLNTDVGDIDATDFILE